MKIVSAGFLIIGNEILSGRTQDKNLQTLALKLNEVGIRLCEVKVVLDIEREIVESVNYLRQKHDYVFTSGGIGPTHDDITTESMAKAFNTKYELNDTAFKILQSYYLSKGEDMNEARTKMAYIPHGASLIHNEVSAAPGFKLDNVFVMAGVPRIFNAMLDYALPSLQGAKPLFSLSVNLSLTEGVIATKLEQLQNLHPDLEIGSYPQENRTTNIVVSGYSQSMVELCIEEVKKLS